LISIITRLSDQGTRIQLPAEAEFFFPSQKHLDKQWSAISPLSNGYQDALVLLSPVQWLRL